MEMRMKSILSIVSLVMMVVQLQIMSEAQQSYVNNKQLDCYNHFNTTDGFVCNGIASSCLSYLTFRSLPPYNSPALIAYLLGSDPKLIARANNISDVDTIPTNSLILVPVKCSCARRTYYQHNASYTLKKPSETYFSVANNTYQGLTTCQALMAQNPFGDRNLSVNLNLQIPLRCACPTRNQTASAVKYLLLYLVTWQDSYSSIAARFGVQPQSVWEANRLSSADNIYPFTPLLIPLTTEPSLLEAAPPSPPPPAPPPQTSTPAPNKSSSNKWVLVGVSTGVALLLLLALSALLLYFFLRRRREPKPKPTSSPKKNVSDEYSAGVETKSSSWSTLNNANNISSESQGLSIRSAVESLSVYKLEEIERATDMFSETNRIQGSSVYRGKFKGDEAAIKVMKGDVSTEINILKRINHSNIIRLSGFCVSGGNTYLVYEYAEGGSLSQWLLGKVKLSWKQRVEIAYDVADALNYLHNFAHPPYIHKNLKSSNILLDANLRAKLSNFAQTRVVDLAEENQGQFHLTRHVVGTHGYMAPEYIESGLVTPKLDVFAFGVILLELLSGRTAASEAGDNDNNKKSAREREELLSDSIGNVLEGDNVRDKLRDLVDPALSRDYPLDLAFSMAQLAKICVARDLNSRPDITEACLTLSKIRSSTRDWDPSDELQHSSSMPSRR